MLQLWEQYVPFGQEQINNKKKNHIKLLLGANNQKVTQTSWSNLVAENSPCYIYDYMTV